MRTGAALVIIGLLLAGCAGPSETLSRDDDEPISTRTSRTTANGAAGAGGVPSQDEKRYKFTPIETFDVFFPKKPGEAKPAAKRMFLNGTDNRSFLRVTSQYYANGMNPVHSGSALITTPPGIVPFQFERPVMYATWSPSAPMTSHSYTTPLVFPNGPGSSGYQAVGTATKRIVPLPEYPTPATFTTRGWGDLYVKVVLEEARLKELTTKET